MSSHDHHDEPPVCVELTTEEAMWLCSAARRGAETSHIQGAKQPLYALAAKIDQAIKAAEADAENEKFVERLAESQFSAAALEMLRDHNAGNAS